MLQYIYLSVIFILFHTAEIQINCLDFYQRCEVFNFMNYKKENYCIVQHKFITRKYLNKITSNFVIKTTTTVSAVTIFYTIRLFFISKYLFFQSWMTCLIQFLNPSSWTSEGNVSQHFPRKNEICNIQSIWRYIVM